MCENDIRNQHSQPMLSENELHNREQSHDVSNKIDGLKMGRSRQKMARQPDLIHSLHHND